MFSALTSKKTTRANSAVGSSAAGPSTSQPLQPPAPSTRSPMRTRSGKILAPIAEGVKTVRAKLAGGRRSKKAPAEAPEGAEASTSAQAVATSSDVANTKPAPAPRKAAPKRRATTARGRTTKGKAAAKPAPIPATPPASPPAPPAAPISGPSTATAIVPAAALAPVAATTPTAVAATPAAALAPAAPVAGANARVRPEVPEHRRLKRQGAYYFDKGGRILPEGEYLDKDGNAPMSALLKEVEKDKCLEEAMSVRTVRPGGSIYGLTEYASKLSFVYQPLNIRLPDMGPIVFPSIPNGPQPVVLPSVSASPMPAAFPSALDQSRLGAPASPQAPREEEIGVAPRSIGTRISRQYAVFFNLDGGDLPSDEGSDELVPIGEIVAKLLQEARSAPSSSIEAASPSLAAAPAVTASSSSSSSSSSAAAPLVADSSAEASRPYRKVPLRRHHAELIFLDDELPVRPPSPSPARPLPPNAIRITRQNAVYLDKDGFALPEGVTTTREAQFPEEFGPSASASGSARKSPVFTFTREEVTPAVPAPEKLRGLFARRSKSKLAGFNNAETSGVTAEKPAVSVSPEAVEEPAQAQEEETVVAPSADLKGKKRAREPEDVDGAAEDAPRVQRPRTVKVCSFTAKCSLLKATVTVFPVPAGIQCRDTMVLFPEGKSFAATMKAHANKRSREEFENGAPAHDAAEEPAAKKVRV
ncbi:hypothetical protein C2E23DRAFT_863599 [Lenzites betulinus]|nr:hypothetical protein C2E23DRAFT_863599 [Lenzites betulinus]